MGQILQNGLNAPRVCISWTDCSWLALAISGVKECAPERFRVTIRIASFSFVQLPEIAFLYEIFSPFRLASYSKLFFLLKVHMGEALRTFQLKNQLTIALKRRGKEKENKYKVLLPRILDLVCLASRLACDTELGFL